MASKITHSNLRNWWNNLDKIWQKIFILNLGLELEMDGVKSYVNDYHWNYEKLVLLYEEGSLCSWYKIQKEISNDLLLQIINLKGLLATHAGISDLSPLSMLTKLESLNCSYNKINNIDPLKDLINLKELHLAFNQISSVESLKNLKKLRILELIMNNITSLQPIENLENLEKISCTYNWEFEYGPELIVDLSSKWKKLKILSVPRIVNSQNLANFYPDLEDLTLQNFDGDLSHIVKLKRLKVLGIDRIDGDKLDFLTDLPYLENLSIRGLRGDLAKIKELNKLKVLSIDWCLIDNLDFLVELPELTSLYCMVNRIRSIEPLRYLYNLEKINCRSNRIEYLSPLKDLKKLKFLDCSENKIRSIEPLKDLTNLEYLSFSNSKSLSSAGNKIISLSPFKKLSKLKHLYCYNNPIRPKELAIFKAYHPNCEVIF